MSTLKSLDPCRMTTGYTVSRNKVSNSGQEILAPKYLELTEHQTGSQIGAIRIEAQSVKKWSELRVLKAGPLFHLKTLTIWLLAVVNAFKRTWVVEVISQG